MPVWPWSKCVSPPRSFRLSLHWKSPRGSACWEFKCLYIDTTTESHLKSTCMRTPTCQTHPPTSHTRIPALLSKIASSLRIHSKYIPWNFQRNSLRTTFSRTHRRSLRGDHHHHHHDHFRRNHEKVKWWMQQLSLTLNHASLFCAFPPFSFYLLNKILWNTSVPSSS